MHAIPYSYIATYIRIKVLSFLFNISCIVNVLTTEKNNVHTIINFDR